MRLCLTVAPILLASIHALASDGAASCEIKEKSIVNRSSSGVAQVSNLGLIEMECRFPARPFPIPGLPEVETSVHEIHADGTENLVASKVNEVGGSYNIGSEGIDFDLSIPLSPTELDVEAQDILAALVRNAKDENEKQALREAFRRRMREDPQTMAEFITEHRAGHFEVKCRIMDETRLLGVGRVGLDVLFDGRFSDRFVELTGKM